MSYAEGTTYDDGHVTSMNFLKKIAHVKPGQKVLINELVEIFKEGRLKTVIDRQYPIEKVAEAHTYIATGHKKGNVVIAVESPVHFNK